MNVGGVLTADGIPERNKRISDNQTAVGPITPESVPHAMVLMVSDCNVRALG